MGTSTCSLQQAPESTRRPWVWRDQSAQSAPERSFTVMSYNILADHLAQRHTQLYPYCPKEMLVCACACVCAVCAPCHTGIEFAS